MIYEPLNISIAKEYRKEINDKILYIVNNNLTESDTGISKTEIANYYTGIGGLHGLEYSNYNNYYDYQQEKQAIEQGQFFTPYPLVEWIYNVLKPEKEDLIADLSCGHGSFINGCQNMLNFWGCDIEINCYKVAKYLYPEANLYNTDIKLFKSEKLFDYIVGNPPYNLNWNGTKSEFYYCLKSAQMLKPAGIMAIIVPQSFCSDDFYDKSHIDTINQYFNFVVQIPLDKNIFKDLGVINYSTKLLILQRKSKHIQENTYKTTLTNISNSEVIFNSYIKSIKIQKNNIKNKLFLETLKENPDKNWQYKVEKMLYHIKINPKINKYLAECKEYITKYYKQIKPAYITSKEWEELRIKKKDVILKLKSTFKSSNPKKKNIGLLKTNYYLKEKGIKKSICELVTKENYCFNDNRYIKLINKKIKDYKIQSQKFSNMTENEDIKRWLLNFELSDGETTIKLNPIQLHDTNLFLQKKYCFVQWDRGCGKTITGIAQSIYRLEHNNIKNVFIVSTAISIRNNWKNVLEQFNIDFRLIDSLKDINEIENKQFVLITLDMVVKYNKSLKNFIKNTCQKCMLVFDESDNISNPYSKTTKSILNIFRKLKYKSLMTGTSTRNNIYEFSPQLELLYNNSYNMLSKNKYIYVREDEEVKKKYNIYYNEPIPAYRKGYKLFINSFVPEKITVFGAEKYNQDIYNSKVLKEMIDKTIITRLFKEITGREANEIIQVLCKMNDSERQLYKIAIEEFYKLEYLFSKTGNYRKDAMLKIIKQITLLLRICSVPQLFDEYQSTQMPDKFKKTLELLETFKNDRIAIGTRHISVAYKYYDEVKKYFPERPVFFITGKTTPIKKRNDINLKLENTKNGILISTQQSFSESVNIDSIDRCIITELHWNNSAMSQYYGRFSRYTSQKTKPVYFITYENSIETNLLKMILSKDKLNLFMKNECLSNNEIYDKFGINVDMLKNLMYKENTENGYKIRWGEQSIT